MHRLCLTLLFAITACAPAQHHAPQTLAAPTPEIARAEAATAAISAAAPSCAYQDGEERWNIKTTMPASSLSGSAQKIDLGSLMALKNPPLTKAQKKAIADKRYAPVVKIANTSGTKVSLHEGDLVSVTGYLYRLRCQKDGDYHIEIGTDDAREHKPCLIVELPDPDQVHGALKTRVKSALTVFQGLKHDLFGQQPTTKPVHVTIAGQLFLDAPHIRANDPSGGRGTEHCATNVWEIHPVTDVTVLGPNA